MTRRRRYGPIAGGLAIGLVVNFSGLAQEARVPGEPRQATEAFTPAVSPHPAPHPREKTYIKRKWGIEVMHVRQTAAGYMLEFRYRVLDPKKAKAVFVRRDKPVLTHIESGAQMIVPTPPTTGALPNSNEPIAGRTYWMFVANPGNLMKPGHRVDIEIGDFRVDRLIVEEL
jgi:hypothetical protein